MFQKFYPYDSELEFRAAGQAAVTADGFIGTQKDLRGEVLTEMAMVINVEAITATTGRGYTFRVVGSKAADRSDAVVLATGVLGNADAKPQDTTTNAAGDQMVMRFATEVNGENYRYLDLHLDVVGTGPSITFSAFASKRQ